MPSHTAVVVKRGRVPVKEQKRWSALSFAAQHCEMDAGLNPATRDLALNCLGERFQAFACVAKQHARIFLDEQWIIDTGITGCHAAL